MEKIIGWIAPPHSPSLAARELLGKPCRAHVESTLLEAGIPVAQDPDLAGSQDIILWVREDAPCLSRNTLLAMTHAAQDGQTSLLSSKSERLLLAVAFSKEALLSLTKKVPLAEALNDLSNRPELLTDSMIFPAEHPSECIAVLDGAGYASAFRTLRTRIAQKHMQRGVLLLEPDRTVIEADVTIGAGTLIYGGNTLQGTTVIGENCTLYPNNRFQNAIIGDSTTVENSVLLDCSVGSHTTVGPFAYLRPKTKIGDHCRIGDFVEIKNSSIDDGTKVSHLTYVGDSDLGKDINLGCGVVFVNYDGKTKSRSKVEDHAFIGCNCNLVSPVHIGRNAYLAAGGTITEDVPDDALYVARARGTIKPGWVKQRKEQGKL